MDFNKNLTISLSFTVYSKNLSVFSEIVHGESIDFGENTIDENYKSIDSSIINIELYDIVKPKANDKKIKELSICIICHCNKKESIFYPCGHKCTCYKCAIYCFNKNKKCPKCSEKADSIVQKVYEQFN